MTTAQTTFSPTCNYNLIYVFAVDIPSHRGCLKVGKATVHTKKDADELPPNCPELNSAAMERIKTYTNTVGVKANLLYTEIAVMEKTTASGKTIREGFQDKAVHAVLEHSHVLKKVFTGTTAGEWYEVDLLTVKNAIKAVKQGKSTLSSKEVSKEEPPVQLREEQRDAVDKTLAAEIPANVEVIGDYAFRSCNELPAYLELGCRSIGVRAFASCAQLRRIWLRDTIETISVGTTEDSTTHEITGYLSPWNECKTSLVLYAECAEVDKPAGWDAHFNVRNGLNDELIVIWGAASTPVVSLRNRWSAMDRSLSFDDETGEGRGYAYDPDARELTIY